MPVLRRSGIVALLGATLALVACGGQATPKTQLALWQRFEPRLEVPVSVENPFDPAQADLAGEFVSPSGETIYVPGFVSRDYQREYRGGVEELTPSGELEPTNKDFRWFVAGPSLAASPG